MSTTNEYIFAYPHPSISPGKRIIPCKVDSGECGADILEQLIVAHPDRRDDLKDATLWQASLSSVARLPP